MAEFNLEQFKIDVANGKRKDLYYFYKRSEVVKQTNAADTKELADYFLKSFNTPVYLMYGTLIGALREKDFIPFDHDIDVAYLSTKHAKQDVLEEFSLICDTLYKQGLLSKQCSNGHIHVWSPNKHLKIDLWTSWTEENKLFLVPYFEGAINANLLIPLKHLTFRSLDFLCPANSDKFLDCIYKSWRTPKTDSWHKLSWKKFL